MRLRLDELQAIDVEYDAIPFGCDKAGRGIYGRIHGERFYIGVQDWITDCKARLTFLTTEKLISRILMTAFAKVGVPLDLVDLHATCDLFPIQVPLFIDNNAARDRPDDPRMSNLITALKAEDPNSIIIVNGVKPRPDGVVSFQRAKGANGWEDRNIRIVLTWLPPAEYARLNVIAQWLNLNGAIWEHYEDQIGQLVGRNQGFRKTTKGTTAVMAGPRLAKQILQKCFPAGGKIELLATNRDHCDQGRASGRGFPLSTSAL